jgi:hypothetical protein
VYHGFFDLLSHLHAAALDALPIAKSPTRFACSTSSGVITRKKRPNKFGPASIQSQFPGYGAMREVEKQWVGFQLRQRVYWRRRSRKRGRDYRPDD